MQSAIFGAYEFRWEMNLKNIVTGKVQGWPFYLDFRLQLVENLTNCFQIKITLQR